MLNNNSVFGESLLLHSVEVELEKKWVVACLGLSSAASRIQCVAKLNTCPAFHNGSGSLSSCNLYMRNTAGVLVPVPRTLFSTTAKVP
jgi:hypothetical protein